MTPVKYKYASSIFRTLPALLLLLLLGCNSHIDEATPFIEMSENWASPQACQKVYRGDSLVFRARLTDNIELGSYSIELHNNFDHHTHSTSVIECDFDPIKTAINPFLYIKEFSIPAGLTEYQASVRIDIPKDIDTGDYHFMIRLTDKAGWQTFKGISIKIAEKNL